MTDSKKAPTDKSKQPSVTTLWVLLICGLVMAISQSVTYSSYLELTHMSGGPGWFQFANVIFLIVLGIALAALASWHLRKRLQK